MNSLLTVIRFTFGTRFRSRSFRVMTLILAVLATVVINLPSVIEYFSSKSPTKIGVFPDESPVAAKLLDYAAGQPQLDFQLVPLDAHGDAAARESYAKEQVAAKAIKGYLRFSAAEGEAFPSVTYNSEGALPPDLGQSLQTALRAVKTDVLIAGSSLSAAQKAALREPVRLESRQISLAAGGGTGKSESQMQMAYVLVYALLFLIYMGVIGFGNMVAMEITAEKSSRVMEVLIASVSPIKQMFGKIVGICLLGLAQIAMFLVVAAINLNLPHNAKMIGQLHLSLSDLPLELIAYFLIFYLAGFFIYATMFAAVGSLVSRTEEVGQSIMPVTYLIIAAFMIAMYGLNNPTAPFVVAMSYVPFFTPLLMFERIGLASPALWEIWLSIAELLASILGLGWLAAKIYRTGVLMYGKRPSLRELRKAMKAL
jgi:ABC-2 type transport system permease protein